MLNKSYKCLFARDIRAKQDLRRSMIKDLRSKTESRNGAPEEEEKHNRQTARLTKLPK